MDFWYALEESNYGVEKSKHYDYFHNQFDRNFTGESQIDILNEMSTLRTSNFGESILFSWVSYFGHHIPSNSWKEYYQSRPSWMQASDGLYAMIFRFFHRSLGVARWWYSRIRAIP